MLSIKQQQNSQPSMVKKTAWCISQHLPSVSGLSVCYLLQFTSCSFMIFYMNPSYCVVCFNIWPKTLQKPDFLTMSTVYLDSLKKVIPLRIIFCGYSPLHGHQLQDWDWRKLMLVRTIPGVFTQHYSCIWVSPQH